MSDMDYTYQELNSMGIDTSMIAVCKKIRNLAKLDNVELDETMHWSGLNKHLFNYLLYCGYNVLDYIKEYLKRLQPYMIEKKNTQEVKDTFICVIDKLYRVYVYIKIDNNKNKKIIVSFHEDNIRGVSRSNAALYPRNRADDFVPIFAEGWESQIVNKNQYVVNVLMQRGLLSLNIHVSAKKAQDVYIVRRGEIETNFINYCNDYLTSLYTSNLDIDFSKIELFSILQQISFTSYNKDTFSTISLLIDSLCVQNDTYSKRAADYALVTFIQNLKLTTEQKDELIELLEERFSVSSIKNISDILQRIRDNLMLVTVPQITLPETQTDEIITINGIKTLEFSKSEPEKVNEILKYIQEHYDIKQTPIELNLTEISKDTAYSIDFIREVIKEYGIK